MPDEPLGPGGAWPHSAPDGPGPRPAARSTAGPRSTPRSRRRPGAGQHRADRHRQQRHQAMTHPPMSHRVDQRFQNDQQVGWDRPQLTRRQRAVVNSGPDERRYADGHGTRFGDQGRVGTSMITSGSVFVPPVHLRRRVTLRHAQDRDFADPLLSTAVQHQPPRPGRAPGTLWHSKTRADLLKEQLRGVRDQGPARQGPARWLARLGRALPAPRVSQTRQDPQPAPPAHLESPPSTSCPTPASRPPTPTCAR